MASVTRPSAKPTADATVDVVIPVYNAADDLERCVESVLAHTERRYRLVLIDDASPDPAVAAYFAALKLRTLPHVVLLRNRRNRGFPGTANRGMRLSRADVVLLNSDTVVTDGWLTALARCATSSAGIGTVTPFSNNAEICSFPRFCANNEPGAGDEPERIRTALARAAVPTYPALPTGVGFCFYVRRELIDAIGEFDTAFGPGYGEENDFCMRALAAGYRSVLCDDAYVLHLGGRSFEGQKPELGARNMALLLERHPRYAEIVDAFIARDPLRPLRDAALAQHRVLTGPTHGVLHVLQSHGGGGGTARHARTLVAAAPPRYRQYIATAVGDDWRIEEPLPDGAMRVFDFRRQPAESWPAFLGGIAATFRIGIVHLHSIAQCREGLIAALEGLDLPYGYTAHDLAFACPTITLLAPDGMYCGGVTDEAVCTRCLGARAPFRDIDIAAWRARHRSLLERSTFLIAPSQWAASMIARYFPGRSAEVIPHGATLASPARTAGEKPERRAAVDLPDDGVPTIAVLGAIGPDKGSRRLERMVERAGSGRIRVRFVLIGYSDVENGPWQNGDATLTIHGRYEPSELPHLLSHYRARLIAFPSAGPESFSLTLSEAWLAGFPVVVPPIGALAERVRATGAGWLWTDAEWRSEDAMLARIAELVAPSNDDALATAAARAHTVVQPTVDEMAQRTLEQYDACVPAIPDVAPFSASRVRDALGYVSWSPPDARPSPASDTAVRSAVSACLRRSAQDFRRSSVGRALARLTPSKIRGVMKRRLS